ncbi:MAG: DUF3466 family protein [Phycisphaerales bacterium]|nr:DUF3466 family protein [Phycisphaerales bacterium]
MQRKSSSFLTVTFIVCSVTFVHGTDYSVTLISAGPAPSSTYVRDINNSGQIIGNFQDPYASISYAFIYANNTFTKIDSFVEGWLPTVMGINDSGLVTGYAVIPGGYTEHAFLYSQKNGMTDLGSLGDWSWGTGINAAGQVTGISFWSDLNLTYRAFLYTDGVMQDLGTLGGTRSAGWAVNASGQVAGESYLAGDVFSHAFLYSNDTMIDLGTLGGAGSRAFAINDAGQVTGNASSADDTNHAFLYTNGEMIGLGEMTGLGEGIELSNLGFDYSNGLAINNLGQVVGYAYVTSPFWIDGQLSDEHPLFLYEHAFLYTDGQMIDLNSLIDPDSGWILAKATGINDLGQIVGNGWFNGQYHAFLLTPISSVPEPATLPVLALATFALIRRRHRA